MVNNISKKKCLLSSFLPLTLQHSSCSAQTYLKIESQSSCPQQRICSYLTYTPFHTTTRSNTSEDLNIYKHILRSLFQRYLNSTLQRSYDKHTMATFATALVPASIATVPEAAPLETQILPIGDHPSAAFNSSHGKYTILLAWLALVCPYQLKTEQLIRFACLSVTQKTKMKE
ncbi:hypothetical protein BCR41DRAFT_174515 [Lobosporangium transversale]|uniref:Uncharacterized protein n=1 Tax=Lobosporangium transversale TaxID=64571 RepID=A0A1Y2GB19_9FUNG|nr:hypothetical protein BCR41DRAFT_174515 [Lobosporangium transversale]ORZ05955.1 hypothetical protein BCR41DRAFT_174515 [Lobosporangium transversale]|eukprot:XP_021877336.1 hypothetical protein BCR41DRAFT_174515 [Lobosporangium transversale]